MLPVVPEVGSPPTEKLQVQNMEQLQLHRRPLESLPVQRWRPPPCHVLGNFLQMFSTQSTVPSSTLLTPQYNQKVMRTVEFSDRKIGKSDAPYALTTTGVNNHRRLQPASTIVGANNRGVQTTGDANRDVTAKCDTMRQRADFIAKY